MKCKDHSLEEFNEFIRLLYFRPINFGKSILTDTFRNVFKEVTEPYIAFRLNESQTFTRKALPQFPEIDQKNETLKQCTNAKLTFKDFRVIKNKLFPKKPFTQALIDDLVNRSKVMKSQLHAFPFIDYKQSEVIAFRSECSHFHQGKVIETKPKIIVKFEIGGEDKINEVKLADLMYCQSVNLLSPLSVSVNSQINVVCVDLKAVSSAIVLLRLKRIYLNALTESRLKVDVDFLKRNIATIDKSMKNILLKTRLRFENSFGCLTRH
jgi:hypothetical protein